jgi:Flp pilus assembly protein TadD
MKTRIATTIASLLCLVVAAGALGGCASSGGNEGATSSSSEADDDDDSQTKGAKAIEAKQQQDARKSSRGPSKFVITTLTPASVVQGSVGTQALSDAILDVEETVRKDQDDVPMVVTFLALLRMAGNGGDIQKNLSRAAGTMGAKNPWFLLETAYGALTRKEYSLTEYLLGKADRFAAGDAQVKAAVAHAWGVRYMVDRKQSQGIYEMNKAARANYLPALVTLGYLALRSGDYIGAERNFRVATASAGENFNAKMGLGIALRVRGKADEAEPLLAQVYKLKGQDRRVAWNYALALSELPSRRKDAIGVLEKYFQLPGSLGDVDGRANTLLQKLQTPPARPASPAAAPAPAAAAASGGDPKPGANPAAKPAAVGAPAKK